MDSYIRQNSIPARRSGNRAVWLVLSALFFAVLLLSSATPPVYDDFFCMYKNPPGVPMFSLRIEDAVPITGFGDVLESLANLYCNWSGRVFYLLTMQSLMLFPKLAFDLLNAAAAAGVVFCIARTASGARRVDAATVAAAAGLFLLSAPAPGQTLFWMSGAVCYLWPALFYLLLLLPYRLELDAAGNGAPGARPMLGAGLFFAGLIGCNANENTGGAVILMLAVMLFIIRRKNGKIPFWGWCGLAGAVCGLGLLLAAPGLQQRMAFEHHVYAGFWHNAGLQTGYLFALIPGLLPLAGALFYLYYKRSGKIVAMTDATPAIMLLGALASCYAMVLSPYTPGRAVFGTFIFLLCAVLGMVELLADREDYRAIFKAFAAVVLITGFFALAYAYRDVRYTSFAHRERLVRASEGVPLPQVIGFSRYNAMYKTDILRSNPEFFVNGHYAKARGLSRIFTDPEPLAAGMDQSRLRYSSK